MSVLLVILFALMLPAPIEPVTAKEERVPTLVILGWAVVVMVPDKVLVEIDVAVRLPARRLLVTVSVLSVPISVILG